MHRLPRGPRALIGPDHGPRRPRIPLRSCYDKGMESTDGPRVRSLEDGLLVVDKPSGMRVHPANADGVPDLVTWLEAQPDLERGFRPIHRLDLETSGLVLCAADPALRAEIGRQFTEGRVHKTYLALVYGRTHRKGAINRALQDQRRQAPLAARTRYKKLEWLGGFTFLTARPESGRKHQIRRHFQGVGHAVVGDERYPLHPFRAVPGFPGRLWLHAWKLSLTDGRVYESPLPGALVGHLELLRGLEGARGSRSREEEAGAGEE